MDAACEAQPPPPPPLLIMCWNVAAWQTAARLVVQHYGSVGAWLRRHGCHILCLQEVKYTAKSFEENMAASGALEDGFESAWSLSRPPSTRMGFDGVATFCQTGRMQGADASPLGVVALDCEGRCLLTDHGALWCLSAAQSL
jgi:exonuclease III